MSTPNKQRGGGMRMKPPVPGGATSLVAPAALLGAGIAAGVHHRRLMAEAEAAQPPEPYLAKPGEIPLAPDGAVVQPGPPVQRGRYMGETEGRRQLANTLLALPGTSAGGVMRLATGMSTAAGKLGPGLQALIPPAEAAVAGAQGFAGADKATPIGNELIAEYTRTPEGMRQQAAPRERYAAAYGMRR
jgi:hypothetical protein